MSCIKSTEHSIHTRRCFITGEYCSQQTNIQKERQRLHNSSDGPGINAFVVMNFSSMSDVVYESRIVPFIKSLAQFLYLDIEENRIACVSTGRIQDIDDPTLASEAIKKKRWKQVKTIHIHRADSNPVSNYIICNRICQQLQVADLIVVDTSVESANVFYEFGLATAFRKLILPICFSDSFFSKKLPENLETAILSQQEKNAKTVYSIDLVSLSQPPQRNSPLKNLEKHIDCYPWRRKLFEHFGIRFQEAPKKGDPPHELNPKDIHYVDASLALAEHFGFSDHKYAQFPYMDKIDEESSLPIGRQLYEWLMDSYNTPQCAIHSTNTITQDASRTRFYNSEKHPFTNNTLVVYTMDQFLNADESGMCIINFYRNITQPMLENHCFCGDRVAILGQTNWIWENPKDSQTSQAPLYRVSDLIRIGMNQATYQAERRRIKTGDYLNPAKNADQSSTCLTDQWKSAAKKQIKTHIRNRCIPLSPENPIYVTQLQGGIQKRIPNEVVKAIATQDTGLMTNEKRYFFCLYHVMLDTLRYTNEIVVDLSHNSVQAMFWLGAAHGSDVYAITVRHEMSEREKAWSNSDTINNDRPIFDLGGLWTAMLRYGETESFYKQLELIQLGIDQHAKLKLPESELEPFEEETFRQLYQASPYLKYGSPSLISTKTKLYRISTEKQGSSFVVGYPIDDIPSDPSLRTIQSTFAHKRISESKALESYYRDRFWRQMLRDNQLHLFLPMEDTFDANGPRLQLIKWDMDTVAELSHYLSKRKVIGKYQFDTLRKNHYYGQDEPNKEGFPPKDASKENFICIGNQTAPIKPTAGTEGWSLAKSLNHGPQNADREVRIMTKLSTVNAQPLWPPVAYRGFAAPTDTNIKSYTELFFPPDCITCLARSKENADEKPLTCEYASAHSVANHSTNRNFADLVTTATNHPPEPSACPNVVLHFSISKEDQFPEFHACLKCTGFPVNHCLSKEDRDHIQLLLKNFFPRGLSLRKVKQNDTAGFSYHYQVTTNCTKYIWEVAPSLLNQYGLTVHKEDWKKSELVFHFDTDSKPLESSLPNVPSDSATSSTNHTISYHMLSQLLLWRQEQDTDASIPSSVQFSSEPKNFKYHVSMVGVSGPATKALTALLVDDEQKYRIWGKEGSTINEDYRNNLKRYLPLNTLQTHIREDFYRKFSEKFGDNPSELLSKAIHLSVNYLSTILPQYFLPFLSLSDERRIANALEAFLRTTDSQNNNDFDIAVKESTDTILAVLKELLSNFRGVEALYDVKVSATAENSQTDNRKIDNIELLRDEMTPVISCLYVKPNNI